MTAGIIDKEIGEKILLYDPRQDAVHVLNPTARLIYLESRAGKSPGEIAAVIRGSFKVAEGVPLEEDISLCLAELRRKGLLPRGGAGG